MSASYVTWAHLPLHQFHALPAEKICHFSISSIVYVDKPVRAVSGGRKLAGMEPGKAAVEASAGWMGVVHRKAVVQLRFFP